MEQLQIPKLHLTHGQVIWVLCRGEEPDEHQLRQIKDQIRYLRQVGIPFSEEKRGKGRGNAIRYRFEELVELGVAVYAMRRGLRPRDIGAFILPHRGDIHRLIRQAVTEQPVGALEASWVKSRGKEIPFLSKDISLRLHDRYSETPGRYELVTSEEKVRSEDLFSVGEVYADGAVRPLVPLTRIALELLVWAKEAPDIRPGRR